MEGLVDPIIPLTMEIIENSLSDFQSECANWYKTDTLSQQASGTGGSNERMTYDIEDVPISLLPMIQVFRRQTTKIMAITYIFHSCSQAI